MDDKSKTFMKSAFDSEGDLEYTIDHHMIRSWVNHWHGHPALVQKPDAGDASTSESGTLLRLKFPKGPDEESPEAISWEEFFTRFEEEHLALQYIDEPRSGSPIQPFARLVDRHFVQADSQALADLSSKEPQEGATTSKPESDGGANH